MNYINYGSTPVENKTTFLNEMKLPEAASLRSLSNKASSLFNTPQSNVILSVVEGADRVYCFQILEKSVRKYEIGRLYLDYPNKVFDLYDSSNYSTPKFSWYRKKLISSTMSEMESIVHTEKLYEALVSAIVF